jgi:Protein of unknown function (DUF2510)
MGTRAGWYEDTTDASRLRYWDGTAWTDHHTPKPQSPAGANRSAPQGAGPSPATASMINKEQVAHDLAIAYINNRYGIRVTGEFSVTSSTSYDSDVVRDVTGEGSVGTEFLPDLDDPETTRIGTGERHLFGLGPEKTRLVPTGQYEVDAFFQSMIHDYYKAYSRILGMLGGR